MRLVKFLMVLFVCVIVSSNVAGQDNGAPDSLKLVLKIQPGLSPVAHVEVECSVFVDIDTLKGMGFGWEWDNSDLRMDSAKGWGDFGNFIFLQFFENDDINLTNANQRALCTGVGHATNYFRPDPSGWQRIATFYMTMEPWDVGSVLNIDTSEFSLASDYVFGDGFNSYEPVWGGPISIMADCHCGDPNNDGIDANILDLNFLVNRIFRGGPPPTCNVK